jgi:hypothetical protein
MIVKGIECYQMIAAMQQSHADRMAWLAFIGCLTWS